jgi:hypothetical protein
MRFFGVRVGSQSQERAPRPRARENFRERSSGGERVSEERIAETIYRVAAKPVQNDVKGPLHFSSSHRRVDASTSG